MSQDCGICCEPFNNSTRAHIQCHKPDCDFSYCKTCARTYILGITKDPHCLNCKSAWSQEYIIDQLNRSFCNKDYKKHRRDVLLEREMSKMPETMNAANRQKEIDKLRNLHREHDKKVLECKTRLRQMHAESITMTRNIWNLESGRVKITKQKFIMPCSVDSCRGFLSSAYKCEICEIYTCTDCLVPIGENRINHEHVCNKQQLDNAKFIRETCKACPGMCGEFIYKIDGCDQMWCTTCHTAFSWKTGIIENGVVHNPHYYQAMQNGNGPIIPRVPGDVICGGIPDLYYAIGRPYKNVMRKGIFSNTMDFGDCKLLKDCEDVWSFVAHIDADTESQDVVKLHQKDLLVVSKYVYSYIQVELIYKEISNLHRLVNHVNEVNLPNIRRRIAELENHETTRVEYLLGRIDKEKMSETVARLDLKRQKLQEELYVYELFSACGIDMFRFIVTEIEKVDLMFADEEDKINLEVVQECIENMNKRLAEFKALCNYCSKEFIKIGCVFNTVSNIVEIYSLAHINRQRDRGTHVLRNLCVNNNIFKNEVNQKISISIDNVIICYKWLIYKKIIDPDYQFDYDLEGNITSSCDREIGEKHFHYDLCNFNTKKIKRVESVVEPFYRKPIEIGSMEPY